MEKRWSVLRLLELLDFFIGSVPFLIKLLIASVFYHKKNNKYMENLIF